jgi:hypothetical protein
MKGLCLDCEGERQGEPEGYHHRYMPGDAPPTPPFDHTGMLLELLRLLIQGFASLTKVVHAVHVQILLRSVYNESPLQLNLRRKKRTETTSIRGYDHKGNRPPHCRATPHRILALFDKARLIEHQDALGITDLLGHELMVVPPHPLLIPLQSNERAAHYAQNSRERPTGTPTVPP